MAKAVLGKWQVDLASTVGLEEYGAAMSLPAERIAMLRQLSYTVEFKSSGGESFTAVVTFASDTLPVQQYEYKLGQTFDYQSMDGTKSKLTVTEEGGKYVENYALGDKKWKTVREVNGTVMTSVTSFGATSVTQKLNKV